ncbi:MAG: DUF4175 family protein [Bdellovibrionales bacterium]
MAARRLTGLRRRMREWMSSPSPRVALAFAMTAIERVLRFFAHPILLLVGFTAAAWLGVFAIFPAWAHILSLVFLTALLFSEIGRACANWRPFSKFAARRRVEQASELQHRPLETLRDHPAVAPDKTASTEQIALWKAHVAQAKTQTKKLKWPRWTKALGLRDPYALRYVALVLLVISAIAGRHTLGSSLSAAINPAIEGLKTPPRLALDVWLSPPEYTGMAPVVLAASSSETQPLANAKRQPSNAPISVPEGSIITAHVSGVAASNLTLDLEGNRLPFAADKTDKEGKEAEATAPLRQSGRITIRSGWWTLASWPVRVVKDLPPQVKLNETPTVTSRKSLRFSIDASDDYGVESLLLRVTPRQLLPGARNEPMEIELASPNAKNVHRIVYEDITSLPWAGLPVQLTLVATDNVGHRAESESITYTLPERLFLHPLAQAVIEERHKLLHNPDEENVRNEAANVMAGIARKPAGFRGDELVLMGLRAGAVRIVLDRNHNATGSVIDLMWPLAIRIEDGAVGSAEKALRQAQKDLADALDRKAGPGDVHRLIERLRQTLGQYLQDLSAQMTARPGPTEDLSRWVGSQAATKAYTPDDLNRMLAQLQALAESGDREKALEQLAQLQQALENLRKDRPQLSAAQRQALEKLKDLRTLVRDQKQMLDKTYKSSDGNEAKHDGEKTLRALAGEQGELAQRMKAMLDGLAGTHSQNDVPDNLSDAEQEMRAAAQSLRSAAGKSAMQHQNDALKALQDAEENMIDNLSQNLFLLPGPDNFLERNYGSLVSPGQNVALPDKQEIRRVRQILDELQRRANDRSRPQDERDYLERLLQNF